MSAMCLGMFLSPCNLRTYWCNGVVVVVMAMVLVRWIGVWEGGREGEEREGKGR